MLAVSEIGANIFSVGTLEKKKLLSTRPVLRSGANAFLISRDILRIHVVHPTTDEVQEPARIFQTATKTCGIAGRAPVAGATRAEIIYRGESFRNNIEAGRCGVWNIIERARKSRTPVQIVPVRL